MRFATVTVLAVFAFAASAAPAMAAGSIHEDKEHGYKVQRPRGWETMPLMPSEKWIVAKFLSDKEYFDKEGYGFKPEMRVIVFPAAVTADRGVEKTEEDDVTFIELKNPYKDYKDYMDRNYSGGGWHVALEKEMGSGDLKWTLIEIKVEKLTWGGMKRIVTGVFHLPDADFAVHFEVLEQNYDKLKSTIYGSLNSFQFIPREGSLASATTGGVSLVDESKLTPKERAKRREELQEAAYRKSAEGLPAGWAHFEYKGFYILTHVDKKYSLAVAKQAEAVTNWLEKSFDYLGDEYVRRPIIRICANRDEERAYQDGSGDSWFSGTGREILTHQDQGSGSMSYEFEYVNRRVVSLWFADKDRDISMAMPSWLRRGLAQYVGTARLKGARLGFSPDEYEKDRLREAERSGELKTLERLLQMTGQNFWQSWHHEGQAAALLRFLLDGPGRTMPGAKTFLKDYLLAIRGYVQEKEKAAEAARGSEDGKQEPKTEEEEEEEYRKRQEGYRAAEEELLKEIYRRAFSGWRSVDWSKFEAAYRQFIT